MKKLTALLLACSILFSLCACGASKETSNSPSDAEPSENAQNVQDSSDITFETVTELLMQNSKVWIAIDYDEDYVEDSDVTLFAFNSTGNVAIIQPWLDDYEEIVCAQEFINDAEYYSLDTSEELMYLMDWTDCDVCTFEQDGDCVTFTDQYGSVFYEFTYIYEPAQNVNQISLIGVGEYEGVNYFCEPYLYSSQNTSLSYFYGNWSVLSNEVTTPTAGHEDDADLYWENTYNFLIHFGENLEYTSSGDREGNDTWSYINGELEASGLAWEYVGLHVIILSQNLFVWYGTNTMFEGSSFQTSTVMVCHKA